MAELGGLQSMGSQRVRYVLVTKSEREYSITQRSCLAYPSIHGHAGCFCILAIVNNAVVNVGRQTPLSLLFSPSLKVVFGQEHVLASQISLCLSFCLPNYFFTKSIDDEHLFSLA